MKVQEIKKRTAQDLIAGFLKINVITQCPNTPQGATQSIRTKGSKSTRAGLKGQPSSHK